jgi:hypothetical protein
MMVFIHLFAFSFWLNFTANAPYKKSNNAAMEVRLTTTIRVRIKHVEK